VVSRRFTN